MLHVRAKVADDYLSLYSEWHDGETIAPEDFQKRLHLEAVRVLASGEAEVYYLEDDVFHGHSLIAHLKQNGAVDHVEMFG
jgi:hypothetical protein